MNISGVNLTGVSFGGGSSNGAKLQGVNFSDIDFSSASFDLSGLNLSGVNFSNALNLSGLSFGSTGGGDASILRGINFSGIDFTGTTLDFSGFDLSGASFSNILNLSGLSFGSGGSGATLTGVDFSGIDFTGVSFDLNGFDLSGVSFSGSKLFESIFSGGASGNSGTGLLDVNFNGVDLDVIALGSSFYNAATALSLPKFNFSSGDASEVVLEELDWLSDGPLVKFNGGFEDNVLKFSLDMNKAFEERFNIALDGADILGGASEVAQFNADGVALMQGGFSFGFEAGLDFNSAFAKLESSASSALETLSFDEILNDTNFFSTNDVYFSVKPLKAGFHASVTDIDVNLSLANAINVGVSNSDMAVQAVATVTLADPGVDDGKITLQEWNNKTVAASELITVDLDSGLSANFVIDAGANLFGVDVDLSDLGRFVASMTSNNLLDTAGYDFAFDVEIKDTLQTDILGLLNDLKATGDAIIDDFNNIDLPVIDGTAGDLLGNIIDVGNPLDFHTAVYEYFNSFNLANSGGNAGSNAPTIRGLLDVIMKRVSGGNENALGFNINGSTLEFGLNFEKQLDLGFDFNLSLDQFKPYAAGLLDIVNIDSSGRITVTPSAIFDFGFGIDVGNYATPEEGQRGFFIDSGAGLDLGLDVIGSNLNMGASLDLSLLGDLASSLGINDFLADLSPGLFVRDGTIALNAGVNFSLNDPNSDGRITLSELAAPIVETAGDLIVDLPLYFPDEFTELAGNNILSLSADLTADSLSNFVVEVPPIDGVVILKTLWENPEIIVNALDLILKNVDEGLREQILAVKLPVIGSLSSVAEGSSAFINTLRNDVLAPLLERLENGDENMSAGDLIAEALEFAFGEIGFTGLAVTADENFDERYVKFDLDLSDQLVDFTVPLDFDAGMPGLSLEIDGDIQIDMGYDFALGFGFDFKEMDFFIDTSGVDGGNGEELSIYVDAFVAGSGANPFEATGTLGFLDLTIEDVVDDRASGLYGSFAVDLQDYGTGENDNNRLTTSEIKAALNAGGLGNILGAELALEVDVDLAAALSASAGDIALPEVSTVFHYDHDLAGVRVGFGEGTEINFGNTNPEVLFENVQLDLGSAIGGFMGPIVDEIAKFIGPDTTIGEVIELLSMEVDLGVAKLKLLDIARLKLTDAQVDLMEKALDAIKTFSDFVGLVSSATSEGGNFLIPFGDFSVGSNLLGSSDAQVTEADVKNKDGSSKEAPNVEGNTSGSASTLVKNIGVEPGSIQFPIINDPMTMLGFLMGKDVDLFIYDLPALDFSVEYVKSFPVFPGLNARIGGSVWAYTDLSFGFDTSGVRTWAFEDNFSLGSLDQIFQGFYFGDWETPGDASTEKPEIVVGASLIAGASLGIGGLVEAGVEGGIAVEVGLDLNDMPNDGTGGNTGLPAEYDGKLRFEELIERLDHGPQCLFDMSGELTAFLEAFFWIGVDLGFLGEVTIFEARERFVDVVLASFNLECPDPANPVVATLTNGVLNLAYDPEGAGAPGDQAEKYSVKLKMVDVTLGELDDGIDNKVERIAVKGNGHTQYFRPDEVSKIYVSGTDYDDIYTISADLDVDIEIHAGEGNDFISVSSTAQNRSREIYGDGGHDTIIGSDLDDWIDGGSGDDNINANAGNNTIYGGSGNDYIVAKDGEDTIYGNENNDFILAGAGNDTVYGGSGNDVIHGEDGDDVLWGNTQADTLATNLTDNDILYGEQGSDEIHAGQGHDYLAGGTEQDTLYGDGGSDTFDWYVGDGEDNIVGANSDPSDKDKLKMQSFIRDDKGVVTDNATDDLVVVTSNGDDVLLSWNG